MNYELRLFNDVLLKFSYVRNELSITTEIFYVNEEKKHLLPHGLELTNEGFLSWLRTRTIPKNRQYVDVILSKLGLSSNDVMGIILVCKGLSLNDSYWIVEEKFKGTFEEYNLYENEFSNVLSLIAYTGYGSRRIGGLTSSPEFTTNGMLPKGWRKRNNKIYLYKGGTSGASNTGNEPYSEYFASIIGKKMGLNIVEYNLARWNKKVCSTCELFTSINISFVPMYRLTKEKDINKIGDYLLSLGQDYYDDYIDMLIFDALIYNEDRHLGNFGLLVDSKTNKPIRFAPLFDHGLSLFNFASDDNLKNLKKYASNKYSSFGFSFDEIARKFITPKQKEKLRRIVNFKFGDDINNSYYDISSLRRKKLEEFINNRIQELLKM